MKQRIIALLLTAAMLLSLAGCGQTAPAETAAPTEPPTTAAPTEPAAADIYSAARATLEQEPHLSMEVVITTVTDIGGDEISQKSTQVLTFKDLDTEEGVAVCQEELEFNVHSPDYPSEEDEPTPVREIWYQGNLYMEVNSTFRCKGPMEQEAMLTRYVPAALLNADLYGSITSETGDGGTTLIFSAPTAGESWAVPEEGELLEASGTAVVTPDGRLCEMNYSVSYLHGPAKVTKTVQSKPLDTPKTVTAPANPDTYKAITEVDALRTVTTAFAVLMQADNITASSLESLVSQAAGVMRNQSVTVNLSGRQDQTKFKGETSVFVMDYSVNESQKYDLEEIFIDGALTSTQDDGDPVTTTEVTWEDIRLYAFDSISGGLLSPDYWQDVTATDLGSLYLLEYRLNDEFGTLIHDGICSMLWNDPNFLKNLSSHYENADLNAYLSVDKYTGLPVASGYYYEGVHTIEGNDYILSLQYDSSIEAPSKGAYHEITDQMPEEPAPETDPTPLFYHVTGENGQEMWLLGTIHVGDARTAYLPEEIYNAFAASDALALECDSEAFEEQVDKDDNLSSQVSDCYFYSDGIMLEDLMGEEEYAQALRLLKATGGYNMNMPYAKPYLWSSSIENFYLRQGYQLHGDQGVEERLHKWAEDLGKEILEVESSLFQIRMLTGFSNDLQLLMLEDVLEDSPREYWEEVLELYETWCAGDEEVLREMLSDEVDTSEFTEEELAEYEEQKPLLEEYNKAMSYDRNDGMLQKAIEYLESGKTVFYAVGLAHLLNNVNGLVDTLREAGYTVELVPYA